MTTPYVLIHRARTPEQKRQLQEILDTGECPFCGNNLAKWHKGDVIRKGKGWILTSNDNPYPNIKLHFLLISESHAESLNDISAEQGASLWNYLKFVEKKYSIASGAAIIRFGDPEENGGSVRHLHIHVLVADQDKQWESVKVKIGSRPGK